MRSTYKNYVFKIISYHFYCRFVFGKLFVQVGYAFAKLESRHQIDGILNHTSADQKNLAVAIGTTTQGKHLTTQTNPENNPFRKIRHLFPDIFGYLQENPENIKDMVGEWFKVRRLKLETKIKNIKTNKMIKKNDRKTFFDVLNPDFGFLYFLHFLFFRGASNTKIEKTEFQNSSKFQNRL